MPSAPPGVPKEAAWPRAEFCCFAAEAATEDEARVAGCAAGGTAGGGVYDGADPKPMEITFEKLQNTLTNVGQQINSFYKPPDMCLSDKGSYS